MIFKRCGYGYEWFCWLSVFREHANTRSTTGHLRRNNFAARF
jgi:hypothetical protein